MIVEIYSKPDGLVGSSIPGCEIFSLLDRKKLARGPYASCVLKQNICRDKCAIIKVKLKCECNNDVVNEVNL